MKDASRIDRFWRKVTKSDECWTWTGAKGRQNYGLFFDGTRLVPAHRVSWEIANGPIPEGVLVCHRCDNPPCIRPDHLFLGTHGENMQDRQAKDRTARGERHVSRTHPEVLMRGDWHYARVSPERLPRGERHGMTTLTAEQVQAIRSRYGTGPSFAALGREFGVDPGTIFNIVRRKTWKHLP